MRTQFLLASLSSLMETGELQERVAEALNVPAISEGEVLSNTALERMKDTQAGLEKIALLFTSVAKGLNDLPSKIDQIQQGEQAQRERVAELFVQPAA